MPLLTRCLVRAGLLWLVTAFVLLVAVAAAPMPALGAAALHALFAGFTLQLICGVALWMFPRPRVPDGAVRRGLGWTIFATLNAGLVLRVIAEPMLALAQRDSAAWGRLLAISALLQLVGALAFAACIWPRVRAR